MKTYNQFINESIRVKVTPKSKEDIKKVWDKYWKMKQLLHDTYPANAYVVFQHGGVGINWDDVKYSLSNNVNFNKTKEEIIELLKSNGLESIGHSTGFELFKIK